MYIEALCAHRMTKPFFYFYFFWVIEEIYKNLIHRYKKEGRETCNHLQSNSQVKVNFKRRVNVRGYN